MGLSSRETDSDCAKKLDRTPIGKEMRFEIPQSTVDPDVLPQLPLVKEAAGSSGSTNVFAQLLKREST